MSIMIIVDAKIKEEGLSTFKEFFGTLLPDTRNFEGCEGVTLCTDAEDSGRLYLVEKWASKEHYEKYHHWRAERGDLQKIRDILDGPVNRVFLDIVNG
ncbi:MAG: hypothetical protein DHS20C13_04090 [Thermodesulfobacteriota bacterium]|nr:MAG: hypothetical protein DHS20C13_04090 [Thermodesulfobacteriota bacterium]